MHALSVSTLLAIILGVWGIPCVALPLVKRLNVPEEHLLFIRGTSAALLASLILRGRVLEGADAYTFYIALAFIGGSVGLYKAIRSAWGPNRTIVMLTGTPALNVLAAWLLFDRRIPAIVLGSLVVLMFGIIVALQPWEKNADPKVGSVGLSFGWGFFSCAISVVSNAAFYETMKRTHAPLLVNGFWIGAAVSIATLIMIRAVYGGVDLRWTQTMSPWTSLHDQQSGDVRAAGCRAGQHNRPGGNPLGGWGEPPTHWGYNVTGEMGRAWYGACQRALPSPLALSVNEKGGCYCSDRLFDFLY